MCCNLMLRALYRSRSIPTATCPTPAPSASPRYRRHAMRRRSVPQQPLPTRDPSDATANIVGVTPMPSFLYRYRATFLRSILAICRLPRRRRCRLRAQLCPIGEEHARIDDATCRTRRGNCGIASKPGDVRPIHVALCKHTCTRSVVCPLFCARRPPHCDGSTLPPKLITREEAKIAAMRM